MKLKTPVNLNIKIDSEVKTLLAQAAEKRGMDVSKLARAVLTNFVKPQTFRI